MNGTLNEYFPKALYYYHKIEVFCTQCHLLSSFWLTCELMINAPRMFTWWQGNRLFCKCTRNVLRHAQCKLANPPFCPADSVLSRTSRLTLTFCLAAALYPHRVYGAWILVLWNKFFLLRCQCLIRPLHRFILVLFALLSSETKYLTISAVLTVNSLKSTSL